VKETDNGQVERDRKRIKTHCRRTVSGEGYITRRSERGMGRERIATYDNKNQKDQRCKTLETGPKKEERNRGQKAICKTKMKVWWLGRLTQEGSPDPGKTHQIRCCMETKRGTIRGQ